MRIGMDPDPEISKITILTRIRIPKKSQAPTQNPQFEYGSETLDKNLYFCLLTLSLCLFLSSFFTSPILYAVFPVSFSVDKFGHMTIFLMKRWD